MEGEGTKNVLKHDLRYQLSRYKKVSVRIVCGNTVPTHYSVASSCQFFFWFQGLTNFSCSDNSDLTTFDFGDRCAGGGLVKSRALTLECTHSSIGSHWFTCWNLGEVENKLAEGRDPNALVNWKLSEDSGTIIYKSYWVVGCLNYKWNPSILLLIFSQMIKWFVENLMILQIWRIVAWVL